MSGVVGALKQLTPISVKRRVKRLVPPRFYGLVDPEWHRRAVGGLWDEVGRLQLDYLVSEGLRPDDYLLDVGCGSLRGGVHFIRYLEPGHYFGVDKSRERLDAGRSVELPRHGLINKHPILEVIDDFAFERLGRRFDYAIAQSVFTHLPANLVERCLHGVGAALDAGGRFYATFNEPEAGADAAPVDRSELPFRKDPIYWYRFDQLRAACEGTGLTAEYIGEWGHPRGQKMALFRKG
jgi:SAM-dependent methyltransferase